MLLPCVVAKVSLALAPELGLWISIKDISSSFFFNKKKIIIINFFKNLEVIINIILL